jgi:uroporphyrinogen-III synthase
MQAGPPTLSRPSRPTLLLTRPAAQSVRFAESFRNRFGADWPVVTSPMTSPKMYTEQPDLGGISALVFTSETGVLAFTRLSSDRSLPCWCVGTRTAAAARQAGFADVRHGTGNADELAKILIAARQSGPVLHLRGLHAAADLKKGLESAGIETREAIIYEQQSCPITNDARQLLGQFYPVLLPLFSPRAAALATAQMQARCAPLLVAALSSAVAEATSALQPDYLATAMRPDAQGMLDALDMLISADASA